MNMYRSYAEADPHWSHACGAKAPHVLIFYN